MLQNWVLPKKQPWLEAALGFYGIFGPRMMPKLSSRLTTATQFPWQQGLIASQMWAQQMKVWEKALLCSEARVQTAKMLTFMRKETTHGDIGSETGDEGRSDGVRDGGVGALGLLSCRRNDVESNKRVETGRCSLHHLEQARGQTWCLGADKHTAPPPSTPPPYTPLTIRRAGTSPRPSSPR